MQRIFLILFLLLTCFVSFCQTRSATSGFSPRSNQTFVVEDGNLSARNSLFTPRFTDTVEAATYILKDTLGNVIYLYSTQSLWVRTIASGSTKKWSEIGSGGGGSGTVTDVATGYGLTGGPITTTGTIVFDSATVFPQLRATIPDPNLIVQNAGSGTQTWFTSGDTLYMKKVKNTTFISASTDTDSSLLISLITADYGDITVGASTWAIDNDVVTFAKMQNIAQARLLGRYTASTGDMQEISIGSGLALDAGTGVLSATAGGLTIGTTTITSGTNTRVLYNNSGVLGEYTVTGSGTTIPLSTSPDFTTGITIGSVAVPTISSTNTLSNKRWVPRVGNTTSSATPTINTDNVDIYKLTAQTADITSFTTNLSGTPNDGDFLEIQITGTAARAITWGTSFVSSTVTLPTTTTTTATLTVVLQYYTTSSYGNGKWVCVNYF